MRNHSDTQMLSYPIRLPDPVQEEALRLLELSRQVINTTLVALWPRLDEFGTRESTYAYKQVTAMLEAPVFSPDRLWRCQAEQAGRILRSQAQRKQQFALILPLLSQGMIRPKTEKRPAGKARQVIKAALSALREPDSDGGQVVALQHLIEQACNFFLQNGCFPATYEEMQPVPVLKVGILPYAADDGGEQGQAYRLRVDLESGCCFLTVRTPSGNGTWPRGWREPQWQLPLPEPVVARLRAGENLAPTLREIAEPDGTRFAVLDFIVEVPLPDPPELTRVQRVLGWDWGVRTLVTATVVDLEGNRLSPPLFLKTGGFDRLQAHTRRQIDTLKEKVATLEAWRDQWPVGDKRREPTARKLVELRQEIACGWRKYAARNADLAHLAANLLLLLAAVWQVELIAGEDLKSLRSEGRGGSAKGKWVHWRNNSQIRGELWRVLSYKCKLAGLHLVWQHPAGTTHTCPKCGEPAHTYADPSLDAPQLDGGPWLRCFACGWNGARDYAAAINIALLGVTFLLRERARPAPTTPDTRPRRPTMKSKPLNSASYMGAGLALRLPPTSPRGRLLSGGKVFVNGWITCVTLHSALSQHTMLRLCG
jgi:putative transposase